MVALENVKNFRDIQSASPRINILPSKLFRTGCMSKATDLDSSCILKDLNVKSLVDLRSPKELEDDEMLHTSTVYDGCMNYRYDKKMQEWKEDGVTLNGALAKDPSAQNNGRKRFFVSLMSESLIKRGVFFRFRKRIRVSCNHSQPLPGLILPSLLLQPSHRRPSTSALTPVPSHCMARAVQLFAASREESALDLHRPYQRWRTVVVERADGRLFGEGDNRSTQTNCREEQLSACSVLHSGQGPNGANRDAHAEHLGRERRGDCRRLRQVGFGVQAN